MDGRMYSLVPTPIENGFSPTDPVMHPLITTRMDRNGTSMVDALPRPSLAGILYTALRNPSA